MLSTHPQSGRLRFASNLLPTAEGGMASRPGAQQVVTGDIAHAQPWGNRVLLEKTGRIQLWDGSSEIDIAPAGLALQASAFQALTENAQREDRLYVADGVNPLWFVARRAGVYARHTFANSVLDESNAPYPLEAAQAVATWRGRLWFIYGANRARHCQFDAPAQWDPLWVVECQGKDPERALALHPFGERLLIGMTASVWAVTGDSHYNWQRSQAEPTGVAGPDALRADKDAAYWVSPVGIHKGGEPGPISEDLREMFNAPQYPASCVLDLRRRLLLALVGGRLFVMHLAKPGQWGEITGHRARGLIQLQDYTGWYGADGLWLLGARDMPDRRADGSATTFESVYDTWDDIPNPDLGGRSLLRRVTAVILGSGRADATYTVTASSAEGGDTFTQTVSLADREPDRWSDDIAGLDGEPWPMEPVRREFTPYLAGEKFRHRFEAACHLEVRQLGIDYKHGASS